LLLRVITEHLWKLHLNWFPKLRNIFENTVEIVSLFPEKNQLFSNFMAATFLKKAGTDSFLPPCSFSSF